MTRVVIMADGKGTRWHNYMGVSKHQAMIKGERIIERTIRLLREGYGDAELIVTSHDPSYEFEGCRRYEPLNNHLEIDRFTDELIVSDMIFLYGDTYYTDEALATIMETEAGDIMFFGTEKSIVAVKVGSEEVFRHHVSRVRDMFTEGRIEKCKGWQVYQSYTGQEIDGDIEIGKDFIYVDRETTDINTPDEYEEIEKKDGIF